jgi:hypothetical protein
MALNRFCIREPIRCSSTMVKAHTCQVSSSVSLRAYASTEPPNGKIASLQKGLILVVNGRETVGEGTGFGLPVLMYSDETYFSGSSRLYVSTIDNGCSIRKEFNMDRIARNSLRNVTLENRSARNFIDFVSDLYQKHRHLRLLKLKYLTGAAKIDKTFPATASRGIVTVTYNIQGPRITVKADLRGLETKHLRKVFMLNEQASSFYRKYSESKGTRLADGGIGAWDTVEEEWASLQTINDEVGFRLWRVKHSVLRRGREFLQGSLDWVGLDYEINRGQHVFQYAIEISEA